MLYRAPEILFGAQEYSTPLDIWSVGCVMGELYLGKPMFSGDSEISMIFKITEILGKPSNEDWPGVEELDHYRSSYPKFAAKDLMQVIPDLDEVGNDLLKRLLTLDPTKRISAKSALKHPFFDELRQAAMV